MLYNYMADETEDAPGDDDHRPPPTTPPTGG